VLRSAAVLQLRFSQKRHARAIREALERGAHQAVQRFQMDPTKLYIGTAGRPGRTARADGALTPA